MGNGIKMGGGGGGKILNGIVKEFYSSNADIKPNTFVDFITEGKGNKLLTLANMSVAGVCVLDDSRVVIFYRYSNAIYGVVCTVSGEIITAGTAYLIFSGSYSPTYVTVASLSSSTVFISHGSNASNYYLCGIVCTISGTVITVGSDVTINSSESYTGCSYLIPLSSTKVMILHSSSYYYKYYAVICTVSGTSFTFGSEYLVSSGSTSTTYSPLDPGCGIKLSNGNVFISFNASDAKLTCVVLTVSGTVITVGTAFSAGSDSSYYVKDIAEISSGKVLIGLAYTNNYYLYAVVCTISGTTLTFGNFTMLNYASKLGFVRSYAIDESTGVIFYQDNNTYMINYVICKVSGTDILCSKSYCTFFVNNGSFYLSSNSNKIISCFTASLDRNVTYNNTIMSFVFFLKQFASESAFGNIKGLTKTKCTKTALGKVWVLKPPCEIVSWASGTDAQICKMVEAADKGLIDLSDYWKVGDTRAVSLSSMSATGVGESHVAQSATLVLLNLGGKTLETPTSSGRTSCSFVVGLKNCLIEPGYMNSTNVNDGAWSSCLRRTWCNNVFYNAIPSTLRPIFKRFSNTNASSGTSSTLQTSIDYFALASEKEVTGSISQGQSSEASVTQRFSYYSSSSNAIKSFGNGGSTANWFTRSPQASSSYLHQFVVISTTGSSTAWGANDGLGIAPFGCI